MFRVAKDSPLRKPPQRISEQQIVLLDGIRYSADMAGIAIDRLWAQLCFIDSTEREIEPSDIAAAALDAWSIIDAAHRMSDLVENLPGLPNSLWRRIFRQRIEDVLALRDMFEAVHNLELELAAGKVRLVGEQVNQPRSNDWVTSIVIEAVIAVDPCPSKTDNPSGQ